MKPHKCVLLSDWEIRQAIAAFTSRQGSAEYNASDVCIHYENGTLSAVVIERNSE